MTHNAIVGPVTTGSFTVVGQCKHGHPVETDARYSLLPQRVPSRPYTQLKPSFCYQYERLRSASVIFTSQTRTPIWPVHPFTHQGPRLLSMQSCEWDSETGIRLRTEGALAFFYAIESFACTPNTYEVSPFSLLSLPYLHNQLRSSSLLVSRTHSLAPSCLRTGSSTS